MAVAEFRLQLAFGTKHPDDWPFCVAAAGLPNPHWSAISTNRQNVAKSSS